MALQLVRDIKEFKYNTFTGTKLYPIISVHDFDQIAQSINSFTMAQVNLNFRVYFPATTTISSYLGYVDATYIFHWYSSGNYVLIGNAGVYYGGIVSGVGPAIGSGYVGLDITVPSNPTNQQYMMAVTGVAAFFN